MEREQKMAEVRAAREAREQKMAEARAARDEQRRKAAEEKAQAEAEAAAKVYVVQAGDTLGKISGKLLGDATRWKEIWEANKDQIKDPNLIQIGQELRIP